MDDRTGILGTLAEDFYKRFLGAEAELKCFDAFRSARMPAWFLGFREGTPEEDYAGCDCIVQTDVGEARVQIKRSDKLADKFAHHDPLSGIVILVIPPTMDNERVETYVSFRLAQWRNGRLKLMRKWRPAWAPIVNYSSQR
jgi:hypothetical protein